MQPPTCSYLVELNNTCTRSRGNSSAHVLFHHQLEQDIHLLISVVGDYCELETGLGQWSRRVMTVEVKWSSVDEVEMVGVEVRG